jgi:hypothetical protein
MKRKGEAMHRKAVPALLHDIKDYIRSTEPRPSKCAACGREAGIQNVFMPAPSGMPWRCECGSSMLSITTVCPSADPRILLQEAAAMITALVDEGRSIDARLTRPNGSQAIGSAEKDLSSSSSSSLVPPGPPEAVLGEVLNVIPPFQHPGYVIRRAVPRPHLDETEVEGETASAPAPARCDAEMCVCGHFHCRHSGIWKGSQCACDDCGCLIFSPVAGVVAPADPAHE